MSTLRITLCIVVALSGNQAVTLEPVLDNGLTQERVGQRRYSEYVREFLDILIEHGTDRYGDRHAPLLVSILDVRTRECPPDPEKFDEDWRVIRRGRRNPAGTNLFVEQPTLKTLYLLSEAVGTEKYSSFADTYVSYAMNELVDEKGLFWWGWHRHFDVHREKMTGNQGNHHEITATHCIDWERLWEVDPEAVRKEIEAIWEWHVIDKETGEIDRHDSKTRGCDFSMAAGAFVYAFAFLSTKTEDETWLERARLLARYYWDRRNKETNLIPDRPNAGLDRFDGSHFVTAVPGLHCHALLKTYELTGEREFRDYACAYLNAYIRYGLDEKTGGFWGSLTLDGTPVAGPRLSDGYEKYEPRGHLDLWEPYVLGYQYPVYVAQVYAYAYSLTKNEEYLTMAKRFAHWIARQLPADACMSHSWYGEYASAFASSGTYAGKYGRTVSFFLHLYLLTGEEKYLNLAKRVANEAVSNLYYNGLFRGHPGKPYYEATDGVGFLVYALLQLDAVLTNPGEESNGIELRLGENSPPIPMSPDNW